MPYTHNKGSDDYVSRSPSHFKFNFFVKMYLVPPDTSLPLATLGASWPSKCLTKARTGPKRCKKDE